MKNEKKTESVKIHNQEVWFDLGRLLRYMFMERK